MMLQTYSPDLIDNTEIQAAGNRFMDLFVTSKNDKYDRSKLGLISDQAFNFELSKQNQSALNAT